MLKRKRTEEQIEKRKKFDDAVFVFVMQSLRSGVGSSAKTLKERRKKWKLLLLITRIDFLP